jgi:hypothetical protein
MNPSIVPLATEPFAATRTVKMQRTGIQISNLTIERQGIIDYLKNITADKMETALVHALEVGVVEIALRRADFRRRTENRA